MSIGRQALVPRPVVSPKTADLGEGELGKLARVVGFDVFIRKILKISYLQEAARVAVPVPMVPLSGLDFSVRPPIIEMTLAMSKQTSSRKRFHILVLCLVLPLYGTSGIMYFALLSATQELARRLAPAFFALLTFGILVSLLLALIEKQRFALPMLVLKFLFTALVGIPLSNEPILILILTAIVVLEVQIYLSAPANLVASSTVAIISTLLLREYLVWNTTIPEPPLPVKVQFFLLLAFSVLAGYTLRSLLDRATVMEQRTANLEVTVSKLISANREFQDFALSAGQAAEREERMRISRDIHDTVGYTLTNLIVMMESATDFSKINPEEAERLLERARELAIKGLEDTRRSLRLLRSADASDPTGLNQIQRLIDTFTRATGIVTTVEYGNLPWSLGREVDEAVYHIVQETLINAFRHGHATKIRILFWIADAELRISVADNGRGTKGIKEGIGFQGIQERLRKINGIFQAGNTEVGFEISVLIPFESARQVRE